MTAVEEVVKDKLMRMLSSEDEAALRGFLEELHPYDVATALPELPSEQQLHLLAALAPGVAAEALEHLEPDEQFSFLTRLTDGPSRDILTAMSDDALADLVLALHPRDSARLLRHVPEKDVVQVRQLMSYPETSVGGRMTSGYFSARRAWTAQQVIEHFRKVGADVEVAHYVYVVDRHGNLVGVTSLRDVLLAEPHVVVSEIMHDRVVTVLPEADQEEGARLLSQYDFGALPVVRSDGKMLGVLTADDVFDVAEEEATEDIQLTAGVEPLPTTYSRASIATLYRRRIVWLGFLVVLNLVAVSIIASYEDMLQNAAILAAFLPLLLGSGGNTGSQSATLMVRALATDDVALGDWARTFGKEITVGVMLGLTLGVLAGFIGLFRGGVNIGFVVGITMVLVVVVANLIGAALPFLLSLFKMDPAVASNPLITTIMDVTGLIAYFSIASIILL